MRVFGSALMFAGVAAALVMNTDLYAAEVKLPDAVPAPEVHAAPAGNILPKHIGDTPVPEAKPGNNPADPKAPGQTAPDGGSGPKATEEKSEPESRATGSEPETPQNAPIPEDSPLEDHDEGVVNKERAGIDPARPQAEPDPRSTRIASQLMPPEEITCRQRLRQLGVIFEDRPAESDPAGCSIPYPIAVSALGPKTKLEPPGILNCAMAQAAATFTSDTVNPTAQRDFNADVASIGQASAYVCRPRAGTRKLSEHSFGNALDIARFNLSNGKAVDVVTQPGDTEARFLATIRTAACGPFKTVLGPGSDADHATHFHLDLAPRKHGGTVCQ